jgi:hypothetical protein
MCKATDAAWRSWFEGWWASFWCEGDLPGLHMVAFVHNAVMTGDARMAGELRLQMDGYGLTPRGRLSLRWAPPKSGNPEAPADTADPSPYSHLRSLPPPEKGTAS